MKARALLHVSLTTADLRAAGAFYCEALGFAAEGQPEAGDAALVQALGAGPFRTQRFRRGRQTLELAVFEAQGAPYPAVRRSNDGWFQHCALVTDDMKTAYARLSRHAFEPISGEGPQALPGGIVAFKFRDPEGHPLELIQFPEPGPATAGGIDHSAIAVADVERSIGFYENVLGLSVVSRQVNTGPAQDAMDGLAATTVDVVGLAPEHASPHLELLGYRHPAGKARRAGERQWAIASARSVFLVDGLVAPVLIHDPDGHAIVMTGNCPASGPV